MTEAYIFVDQFDGSQNIFSFNLYFKRTNAVRMILKIENDGC